MLLRVGAKVGYILPSMVDGPHALVTYTMRQIKERYTMNEPVHPPTPAPDPNAPVCRSRDHAPDRIEAVTRAGIAYALICTLLVVMVCSLFVPDQRANQMLPAISGLVGSVVGYYFGSRKSAQ